MSEKLKIVFIYMKYCSKLMCVISLIVDVNDIEDIV